jgi:hypothetical protein
MSDSEAQIWKLFEKLEGMERKLTAVTEQRDEALSDLAFSRDLYRLQTKTIDDVREHRDEWKAKYIQQNKDLGYELRDPNGTIWSECKRLQTELTAARAEIERLDTAGIHSCHKDCQRPNCVLRRERDELATCLASEKITRNHIVELASKTERELNEARRLAERYRDLSCDSQDEADETLLPWETTNQNEL